MIYMTAKALPELPLRFVSAVGNTREDTLV